MSRLTIAREEFVRLCHSGQDPTGAHTATFQPLVQLRINEDRCTVHSWSIAGQEWVFLGLCDGHTDCELISEHTITHLPDRLRQCIDDFIQGELHGATDRDTLLSHAKLLSAALGREVQAFDEEIGAKIKEICPEPEKLTEEQGKILLEENIDIIRLAYQGCTFVAAFINVTSQCMWTVNLGDSSVGISTRMENGRRKWKPLYKVHAMTTPDEYFRVSLHHPSSEQDIIGADGRLLGFLGMTRAIGDYRLKFPAAYITHLFRFLPADEISHPDPAILKTPPYVSNRPSTRFIDLQPLQDKDPIVLMFSDGVDCAAAQYRKLSHPGVEYERFVDAGELLSQLLGNEDDRAEAEALLGHPVEQGWLGAGNRAVELLGNVFGGTDAGRIEDVNRQANVTSWDDKPSFYVDDTTLIAYPLPGR
ncbi:protein serine/threonine phosphatase 2C [Trametes polyzona]|nr:protein serine/threonine phosphatase 2C [Trametes polyzona]